MRPKVSVVVPVYNVEQFLKRCVESILNQSYKTIEVILVNDGSTDASPQICNDYKASYPNIVVIHREKSGGSASKARNDGIKAASGDYITFIDSDDWIHPRMVELLLSALQVNNTKVAECNIVETSNYEIRSIPDDLRKHTFVENRINALTRIINNQRFSVCVRLYELNLVRDITFPEGVISEDVYFTLDVFKRIEKLVRIDQPFYYYYITPNSVTRKTYNTKYFDSLNSGLHLQDYINTNEKDPELLKATQSHILKKLLYHYKMLNYFPKNDLDYKHRKRIKQLIDTNYFSDKTHELYLKYANILSIKSFEVLINLNKLRHKVFKTYEFK